MDIPPGIGEAVGLNEAWRDAQAGNWGLAAAGLGAMAAGVLPGAGDVAGKGLKTLASRTANIYDPPVKSPRPFEADYPQGALHDEAGRLTHDIEGRPLVAEFVAGRRMVGGSDQALTSAEIRSIGEKGTGRRIEKVPQRGPRGLGTDVGRVAVNRYSRQPEEVFLSEALTEPQAERVLAHEVGHVIDQAAGEIPTDGLSRELADVYNTLNTGRERATSRMGPQHVGYRGGDVPRELMAEAIRAYMIDPNYLKTVAPKTAARIRQFVNADPHLSKTIQFNSLLGAAVTGGLYGSGDDNGDL